MALRKQPAPASTVAPKPAAEPAAKPETKAAAPAAAEPGINDDAPWEEDHSADLASAPAAGGAADDIDDDAPPPVAGADLPSEHELEETAADTEAGLQQLAVNRPVAPPAARNNTPTTTVVTSAMQQVTQELEAAGFVTDDGFGSFPQLVLNNLGQFQVKDWQATPLDKLEAVHVIVVQVKRKYLYREKKERDARIAYSYDAPYPENEKALTAKGTLVSEFIDELVADGAKWECKLYYEALAVLVGGEGQGWQGHEEEMILISLSPVSKTKWSGFVKQTAMMKKRMPHQFVTRISRGPSMTVQGQNFYPMAFKALRPANLDDFAAAENWEISADA